MIPLICRVIISDAKCSRSARRRTERCDAHSMATPPPPSVFQLVWVLSLSRRQISKPRIDTTSSGVALFSHVSVRQRT